MKVVCKTKCFYGKRLWQPGEVMQVADGKVPPHFAPVGAGPVPVPQQQGGEPDPTTLAELQNQKPPTTNPSHGDLTNSVHPVREDGQGGAPVAPQQEPPVPPQQPPVPPQQPADGMFE